ncbi:MAG TPA: capsule biosynthesis protein [Lachnospiraceae bacterium]|nr:capsule biosynthesis protein [Lachnospiraceae bacterium]
MIKGKLVPVLAAWAAMSLILTGCEVAEEYIDTAKEIVGLPGDEEAGSVTIEKDNDSAVAPVIVLNTDDPAVLSVSDNAPSDPEEVQETAEEEIYDDVNKIYSMHAASPDEMTLGFAGDICFHDAYSNMNALRERPGGIYDCILPEVMEGIKGVDIFMVNNEFPYSNRGTPTADKKYAFRSKPENVNILHEMGVDIVGLANNHAYDHGPDALIDTIDILNEAKVPFVGAGKNIDEACKPAYFKINGKTISFTAATQIERVANPDTKEATADSPGVLRTLDATRYVKVIEEAAANSDFCVAFVHWGSENTDLVEDSQRSLAKKYAEAGADLIVGAHPHCLQGLDYVEGVPVIYSLGNFWFNSKTVDTGYLKVTLNTDCSIKSLQFVPCVQENCKTRLAEGEKREWILNYMQGISNYAVIDADGYITQSSENHNTQNGQNTSPSKKVEEPAAPETPAATEPPVEPLP